MQIEPFAHDHAGLQPRHIEDVADQCVQAADLQLDARELGRGVGALRGETGGEAHARERRTDLMGHIAKQLLAAAHQARQACRHLVEGAGEAAELIGSLGGA